MEQFLEDYMKGPQEKSSIDSRIKELATKSDLRITVIDSSGVVIADSWEKTSLMENHLERPEIASALIGGQGQSIRYSTTINQNMLYVAIPIWQGTEVSGTVRIASTLAAVDAGFTSIKSTLLLAIFLPFFVFMIEGGSHSLISGVITKWFLNSYVCPESLYEIISS